MHVPLSSCIWYMFVLWPSWFALEQSNLLHQAAARSRPATEIIASCWLCQFWNCWGGAWHHYEEHPSTSQLGDPCSHRSNVGMISCFWIYLEQEHAGKMPVAIEGTPVRKLCRARGHKTLCACCRWENKLRVSLCWNYTEKPTQNVEGFLFTDVCKTVEYSSHRLPATMLRLTCRLWNLGSKKLCSRLPAQLRLPKEIQKKANIIQWC